MNHIENVKKYISDLENEENRKKFAKGLYRGNNPNVRTIIYYDLDNPGVYFESLPQSMYLPNTIHLLELSPIDFEKMNEKEYNEYVDNIIEDLQTLFLENDENIDIEEFKEDSIELTNIELIKKYNIRYDDILKLRKELNLASKKEPKYYSFNQINNKWFIQNNRTYYGSFETEEEAKKAVEVLKRNNWNEELFKKPVEKEPKYYYFHKGNKNWGVIKRDKHFGSFKTEEEAQKAVDFLKKNNWNKEMLQKYMKKIPKYYYFQEKSEKWHVKKGGTYYGVYPTEDGAKRAVEFLKENNWDKELLMENKDKILSKGG